MKVSVIMPSYLGVYPQCASDRNKKFVRAVKSYQAQVYPLKQLVIVSDACADTNKLYKEHFEDDKSILLIKIPKQDYFSGVVRYTGIEHADGEIITYLDTDDVFSGATHLSSIRNGMFENGYDWAYFDNEIGLGKKKYLKPTQISSGNIGTSCIAHLRRMTSSWWQCNGYGHDWTFIKQIKAESENFGKLFGPSYAVCHIADTLDV